MVPLVFKTSLGAVRSPEGSTPSLLRQKNSAGALMVLSWAAATTSVGAHANGQRVGAHVVALTVAAVE